jgi:hypothetical protein
MQSIRQRYGTRMLSPSTATCHSTGEIHTYLATPTRAVATSESTSQGVIARRILSDDARKLLQQQLRFGRSGTRFMGLQ